jgi:MerR family transcriptional regulator, redox-sensitive transcriptional activator SoxR
MTSLTVAEVAIESGVSGSAIRFYERNGLIAATRTSGNQRRFDEHAACRVKVARVAQRVGLSVKEIREVLDGLGEEPTLEDWARVHHLLTTETRRRIDELNAALDAIASGDKLCEL